MTIQTVNVGWGWDNGNGMLVSYHDTDEVMKRMLGEKKELWESGIIQVACENSLKKSKVVLDIGSHIGCFSLQARHYNNDCSIICFEPQEEMYKILQKNIEQNKLENIKTYNCAVGDSNKKVKIANQINDGANSGEVYDYHGEKEYNFGGVSLGEGTEERDMITIDSLNLESCEFMKIDVEDYEFFVLCGAEETIIKYKPTILFEHNNYDDNNETVTPSKYMMEICNEKSSKEFSNHEGNIFSLLKSYGYNWFQRFGPNYLAKYCIFQADEGEVHLGYNDGYWEYTRYGGA